MFHKFLASFIGLFAVASTSPALPSSTPVVHPVVISVSSSVPIVTPTKATSCPEKIVYRDAPEKIVYRDVPGPERVVYKDAQCDTSALSAQNSSLNDSIAKGNAAMQQAIDALKSKNAEIDYWKADSAKCNSLLSQSMSQTSQFSDAATRYKALSDKWQQMYYAAIGQSNSLGSTSQTPAVNQLKVVGNQVLWFSGAEWLVKETLATNADAIAKMNELNSR